MKTYVGGSAKIILKKCQTETPHCALAYPIYEHIFNDEDPKEQCFIANVMIANLKKKKELIAEDN